MNFTIQYHESSWLQGYCTIALFPVVHNFLSSVSVHNNTAKDRQIIWAVSSGSIINHGFINNAVILHLYIWSGPCRLPSLLHPPLVWCLWMLHDYNYFRAWSVVNWCHSKWRDGISSHCLKRLHHDCIIFVSHTLCVLRRMAILIKHNNTSKTPDWIRLHPSGDC